MITLDSSPATESAVVTSQAGHVTCYVHSDRETGLYCTQCNRPICTQCAVQALVGQFCRRCAIHRRPINYRVSPGVLAMTVFVTLLASAVFSTIEVAVMTQLPFFSIYLIILAATPAASLIVRQLDHLTRAKRGKTMQFVASIGLLLGAVPVLIFAIAAVSILDAVLLLVFVSMMVTTVLAALR